MTDRRKRLAPLVDSLAADEVSRDRSDLSRHAIDGLSPHVVLFPRSIESVCTVMRIAQEERVAVVPAGSGSKIGSLNTPSRYDAALSLLALDRVLECDADNGFVRVQAGCRLATLEEALASKGQRLPLDFRSHSDGTIGGLMSAPQVGPRYPFLGAPRDVALGLGAVLAGGKLIRPGGVTTKNVAGYDLTRLLVGSCGSLAVVVEVNLRTTPLPECARAIEARFAEPSQALAFACATVRSRLSPSFATVLCNAALADGEIRGASSTSVLLGAEGFEKDVSSQIERFRAAASDAGASAVNDALASYRDLLDAMLCAGDASPDELVVRVSAPMTALDRFANPRGEAVAMAFAGAGVIIIRAASAGARRVLEEVDGTCRESAAHRHVVSAPAEIKGSIDVWGEGRDSDALMRAIKNEFDPAEVLSPGRMPGRL